MRRLHLAIIIMIIPVLFSTATIAEERLLLQTLETMERASLFLRENVSYRGGYLDKYSEDMTRRWGEIPARETQIMCQEPGTSTVGTAFLNAYRATGNVEFLRLASDAANALIWGQHPKGGWHYLIDFDMTTIETWYETEAANAWGWEEYYHYYGNCTFDDGATAAPTRYLLDLYMETLDPKYREPLDKAMAFILESQYENGAWPQRYPLKYDYPKDGRPDYTHFYTFNDGAIRNNIILLLDAWEKLGDELYLEAARRGMDFYLISQLEAPQAGWAQQYTMDMKPGWARTYEPAAVSVHRTLSNLRDLALYYGMTGDKRYLAPYPAAIDWLERSVLTTNSSAGYTHAGFYEPGTNKPLYYHFEGSDSKNYRYWLDQEREDAWWYRKSARPDITGLKKEYARLTALKPEQARTEYEESRIAERTANVDEAEVRSIIDTLDSKGRWITDMRIRQYDKGMLNDRPVDSVRGIDIGVFVRNMRVLTEYIVENEKIKK